MITKRYRFHGHSSLRYVYKNADSVRSGLLVVKYIKNPHRKHARCSIVVSKKVHKGAVGRNRIRRRLYEIVRQDIPNMQGVYDIVIIVSSAEVRTIEAGELQQLIKRLFDEAGLYNSHQ